MKINDRDQKRQLDASVEGLFTARITRREFFRRATALGVSAAVLTDILVLHGKAFAAEGPSPAVLEKIKKEGGELAVYNWEEYIHPDTIPNFEEEFGVKAIFDYRRGRLGRVDSRRSRLGEGGNGRPTQATGWPLHLTDTTRSVP